MRCPPLVIGHGAALLVSSLLPGCPAPVRLGLDVADAGGDSTSGTDATTGMDRGDDETMESGPPPTSVGTSATMDGADDEGNPTECLDAPSIDPGRDRLAARGSELVLRARVPESGDWEVAWRQTAGPSLGGLPSGAEVEIELPDDVTSLRFEAVVTQTGCSGTTISVPVTVLVVEDPDAAWFVDLDQGDDIANEGSPSAPFRTIEHALDIVQARGGDIYLDTPDDAFAVTDTLELPAGVSIYGGFDDGWTHDPATNPTPIVVDAAVGMSQRGSTGVVHIEGIAVQAVAPGGGDQDSVALILEDASEVVLAHVRLRGSDLETPAELISGVGGPAGRSFVAGSSYALRAREIALLTVVDSELRAGAGAAGAFGLPGANGVQGARGGNGGSPAPDSTGGASGNGAGNGAAGGPGAPATTAAVCVGGNPGQPGGPSAGISGGGGGAAGGATFQLVTCELRSAGGGGSVSVQPSSGANGPVPPTPPIDGTFTAEGGLVPVHGVTGATGPGGAGGGGGGSGPGADTDDGGGGGGGGEGGAGGLGGEPGRAAGGSFAAVLSDVNVAQVIRSTLVSGTGGPGGRGGAGGSGGSGGLGAAGADSGIRRGGNGGRGGPGGDGGQASGGAGGPVAGLVLLGGSQASLLETRIQTADAGEGTGPVAGVGGWNFGIFVDGTSSLADRTGATFDLGNAGTGAPRSADVSIP